MVPGNRIVAKREPLRRCVGEGTTVVAAAFEHVGKVYKTGLILRNGVSAVEDVSFSIPKGSVFGLLGPNRAGKTTLVKMLLSLARPTSGTVSRLGEGVGDRGTLGRIGYMHENHAFPRYLSAVEVLTFYGGVSGIPSDQLPDRVNHWIVRVGLSDRKNEPIHRFSKGMVQRLGLAQALLNDPELLILDEPTEGLDLLGRQLLRDVVRELKQSGRTVLLVSHVLSEVQELCDEVAVMVNGRLAFRGKLTDLTVDGTNFEAALQRLYTRGAA
jgi:ABC-2 type transport system ATP-binding protein